jgi:hypothetical protein
VTASPHVILPIDRDALRARVRSAQPFPFIQIDNFLDADFARSVAAAFPAFDAALQMGRTFSTVNEQRKVQITNSALFPRPILELHELLASREWLETLSSITDIAELIADPQLVGGGIHETGPHGRLDVHVDFNYLHERQLFRRLNILVYFNPEWREEWGGDLELWDAHVKQCVHSFSPVFNRCIIFATSSISFHGVSAVTCPEENARKSFAAYYYTREPPPDWTGFEQPTLFKARPNEWLKGNIIMPAERAGRHVRSAIREVKRGLGQRSL